MTLSNLCRSAAAAGALVLALSACGGDDAQEAGSAPDGAVTGTATDKVDVKDFTYKPDPITVKAGTTVTWTFSDDVNHNVEASGSSELTKSPDLKSGATYTFTFTKAGTVEYRCSIHNSMTGTVIVTA